MRSRPIIVVASIVLGIVASVEAEKPMFDVAVVGENAKIYRDGPRPEVGASPVRLALAGNEYGSFQLAILPTSNGLKDVTVSFSPLQSASGQMIGDENWRWFRIGYVKLDEPAPSWLPPKHERVYEPDPLLPAQPFDVPASEIAGVWADLQLPEGTPEGDYAGAVTVSCGGESLSREVLIHSHGFDIPRHGSIPVECWFNPAYHWYPFYGHYAYTPELYAKHANVLGRYRIGSFPCDHTFLCSQVPITREADGRFRFDWTVFDQYVKIALESGTRSFWSNLSCCAGWTYYLNSPETPIVDRATGSRTKIADVMSPLWKEFGETDERSRLYGKAQFENPVYRDFLAAYAQHLADLKIDKMSWYEMFDEANQDPTLKTWRAMLEHHDFFRRVAPGLQLFNFGFVPTIEIEGRSPIGLVDGWGPHLVALTPNAEVRPSWHYQMPVLDTILKRRDEHGEKFWFYTCEEFRDPQGNYTPYVYYNRPNLQLRLHGWMAWRFQVDGFFVYSLCTVPEPNRHKSVAKRWPNSEWSDGQMMGCGTLVYPGPDFEVIPSIRLACLRKGLEDYEYFALLRSEAGKLDPTKDQELAQRVTKALQVEPDIVGSVFDWTKDPNRLESKRAELAKLIGELRAAVDRK